MYDDFLRLNRNFTKVVYGLETALKEYNRHNRMDFYMRMTTEFMKKQLGTLVWLVRHCFHLNSTKPVYCANDKVNPLVPLQGTVRRL